MKKLFPHGSNTESGIILFTVIMMTIILSLVVVEFMSTSLSQVMTSQGLTDQLKAEQIALGAFYRDHQILFLNMTLATTSSDQELDNKSFTLKKPYNRKVIDVAWQVNAINAITETVSY